METLKTYPKTLVPYNFSMNTIFANFKTRLIRFNYTKVPSFCASSIDLTTTHQLIRGQSFRRSVLSDSVKVKVSNAELKEKWLTSLTCPLPEKVEDLSSNLMSNGVGLDWIIGIDPDVSGALALLKPDNSGYSAQVFDNPHVQVPVGKRVRKRLDANSIVQLLRSFDAPLGTTAYIEQSIPFPQDGKLGWWSGGFGYGMWIGVLVSSGFSVVPVPSLLWKNHFELAGSRLSKDDSRKAASTLFPSLSSLLKRKKDHGRAEALLIAAYGKGLKIKSDRPLEIEPEAAIDIKSDAVKGLKIKSDRALEMEPDTAPEIKSDAVIEIKSDAAIGLKIKADRPLEIEPDAAPEINSDAAIEIKLDAVKGLKIKPDRPLQIEPDATPKIKSDAAKGLKIKSSAEFKSDATIEIKSAASLDIVFDVIKSEFCTVNSH